MADFDYEKIMGLSKGGFVKDHAAIGLPNGTRMVIMVTMVLENGVWKYKNGWSKVDAQKAASTKKPSQQEKLGKALAQSTVVEANNEEDW